MTGQIGKYKVERELGTGGFGKVYLAFDPDVGQYVAIKKLRAEGDPDLLKRFQLEIRTTASLRHKNIVTIHASGEESGDPYLVMEFLEGQTLKQVIHDRRPLSLLDKVHIMTQVAEGLAYAHSRGVVHRDVKPENIMLMPDDNVKIMDFGIALGPERKTNVTQTGGIIGTPSYFAPEQLEGSKANEQTDIFSYGDVYYELLTGAHPFERHKNDWRALQIAILSYEPKPLGELLPGCPEALETLVHRTLAKHTEFRYQKFEEVHLDSEAILVDLKHESAVAILREIPALMQAGQLQSAMSRIRQAYQLEPGNRDVRQLRDEINALIQGEQRHKQVAELLSNADRQISEGRYAEAVQSLELALKFDKNNDFVARRLEEAIVRRDNYSKAIRLISEARLKQQKGFLTEAHQRIQEALAVDPDNTDAKRLNQRIGDELKRQQWDQKLQQALLLASEHRAAHRYAEALAVLDEIERDLPGNQTAAELRNAVRNEQAEESRRIRAERFAMAVARTREVMDAGDLDRARQMLDHLAANAASDPGAGELLPPLQERFAHLVRTRDIAQCQERVRALLHDQAFPEALDVLAETRRRFPDDSGLERLNKMADDLYHDHQRSEAVAAVLRDAANKRDSGDLQGALDIVTTGQRQLGEEASLTDLARLIKKDALLHDSRALLTAGKYSEAVNRLTADQDLAGEPEVRALLESAEENRFVEDTLAAAEPTLSAIEAGLVKYPGNATLARAAIEAHHRAIRREMEDAQWRRAQAALTKARQKFPHDAAFDDLSAQIESGLYEEGWREFEARVNKELAAGAVSRAGQQLEDPLYNRDPRWKALAEQVAKRRDYEDALADAEHRRKAGALSDAEELLTRVIDQGPLDIRAAMMHRAIQAQQEIARLADGIRGHLQRDDLTRAQADLAAARSRYPEESAWNELQARFDFAVAEQSIRQSLAGGDLPQATRLLHSARGNFSGAPVWAELEAQLRRQSEIDAITESIRGRLTRDSLPDRSEDRSEDRREELRKAASELTAARKKYSGEALWKTLQSEIDARAAFLDTEAKIAESINQMLQRGEIAQAEARLATARKDHPDEGFWSLVATEIATRREFERQRAEVARLAANVQEQLKRNAIREARSELDAARAKYPNETVWKELQAEIDKRQAALDREAEIANVAQRLRAQFEQEIPRTLSPDAIAPAWEALHNAAGRLDQARAKYPREPIWDTLRFEIASRESQLEHQLADFIRACPDLLTLDAAARQVAAARDRYPGESFWVLLETEIGKRREPLERVSIAEFQASVRESLRQGDLPTASARLNAARQQHPDAGPWAALQRELDQRLAELKRQEEIAAVEHTVRELLQRPQWDAFRNADAALDTALAKYPAEDRLTALKSETAARRTQWEQQLAQSLAEILRNRPAKGFSSQPIPAQIATLHAQDPGNPRWARLKADIDATEARLTRQVEAAAAGERIRASLRRNDIRQAVAELNTARAKYPDQALWPTLQSEVDAWQARHRDQARDRLLAIEAQLTPQTSKRQIKKLDQEARTVAGDYLEDAEIVAIAARIHRRTFTDAAAVPQSKPLPWKLISIAGGVIAAAVALILTFFHGKPSEPIKPPPPPPIAVEIRTDPQGAAVRVGEHSCVTPNCRLDLAPGQYQVEAQLPNYEPKKQTVQIDAANRTVDLTLNPLPPPPPPPTATAGTLVVQAGMPDVLIYVDGVPQPQRTNRTGAATLSLEAKAHEVRVERNGYEKIGARQVTIAPGQQQTIAFRLVPENARIELIGAIANLELRVDGVSIGRTYNSGTYTFPTPVKPGDHTLEVTQGRLQNGQGSGSRSLTQRFELGQTVRLTWKPDPTAPTPTGPTGTTTTTAITPPTPKGPTPEELEERDWDKIKDASDPAPLRDFRRKYAGGKHAKDAEAALERLAWSRTKKDSPDSLRAYVQEFPNGAHAAEANTQIGDLRWLAVDQNNSDQLRKFIDENPNSPHVRDAQQKLNQFIVTNARQDVLRKQVVDVLNRLNVEFNRKPVKEANVKQTWPGVPRAFLDSLKQPGQEISLTPIEEVKMQSDDAASIRCTLNSTQGRVKSQTANVVLHYSGGRWVINSLTVGQ